MSNVPNDLKYTTTHEWVRMENDGNITVGITEHAQNLLGDMVFVELPEPREVRAEEEICVVESVKAAADVYMPVSGEILEVNEELVDNPGLVNSDPYGAGWLFRIQPLDEEDLQKLMDADQYKKQVAAEEH